jgi:hypothetical protein
MALAEIQVSDPMGGLGQSFEVVAGVATCVANFSEKYYVDSDSERRELPCESSAIAAIISWAAKYLNFPATEIPTKMSCDSLQTGGRR